MKRKKVWRYTCEYCGKSGCSAPHISRHERHCTMNPGRECRMCKCILGNDDARPIPMIELLKLLPEKEQFFVNQFGGITYSERMTKAVLMAMPSLRDATNNCPACMLAALRQRGYTMPLIREAFDYDEEIRRAWAEVNESNKDGRESY